MWCIQYVVAWSPFNYKITKNNEVISFKIDCGMSTKLSSLKIQKDSHEEKYSLKILLVFMFEIHIIEVLMVLFLSYTGRSSALLNTEGFLTKQ